MYKYPAYSGRTLDWYSDRALIRELESRGYTIVEKEDEEE